MSLYVNSQRKYSAYCTVEHEGGFLMGEWRPVIQQIHVHENNEDRLRFGYYSGGKFVPRPMEISSDYDVTIIETGKTVRAVVAVFEGALRAGVIDKDTAKQLRDILDGFLQR